MAGNELKYLEEVLQSGWLTTSSKAMEFEKDMDKLRLPMVIEKDYPDSRYVEQIVRIVDRIEKDTSVSNTAENINSEGSMNQRPIINERRTLFKKTMDVIEERSENIGKNFPVIRLGMGEKYRKIDFQKSFEERWN